jgi:predicted component of type VI protein secretion system
MPKCIQCGYNNDASAPSCSLCGAKLSAARTGERKADSGIQEPRLWQSGRPRALAERTTAAREQSRIDVERHFIVPPVGEPLKLEPGPPIVIGREESCDIRLVSTNVSRRHAEVRWIDKPARPTIRDLGSQNGTLLNGIKIESTEQGLTDGDRIQIGDLQATYRRVPAGVPDSSVRADVAADSTDEMPAVGSALDEPAVEAAGLTGDATILPIPEVLKRLSLLRAWGRLEVEVDGARGHLVIENGRPTSATYAGVEGPPAVAAITSLVTGRFRFDGTAPPRVPESQKRTTVFDPSKMQQPPPAPPPQPR